MKKLEGCTTANNGTTVGEPGLYDSFLFESVIGVFTLVGEVTVPQYDIELV